MENLNIHFIPYPNFKLAKNWQVEEGIFYLGFVINLHNK